MSTRDGLLLLKLIIHGIYANRRFLGELFGYYGRVQAHKSPNVAGPFITQNLLILGMAPLIAATVYMSLGRFIKALDLRQHMAISPKLTTTFYIIVDIGCFGTQVVGSVTPASGDPEGIKLGRSLIIGGLIAQLVALSFFILSSLHAHVLVKRSIAHGAGLPLQAQGLKYFWANYATTTAMIVRAVVRGVEYIQGQDGAIASSEAYLYAFDAVPMVAIAGLYLFIHPGRLVRDVANTKSMGSRIELKP